jgi:hypothetical protein
MDRFPWVINRLAMENLWKKTNKLSFRDDVPTKPSISFDELAAWPPLSQVLASVLAWRACGVSPGCHNYHDWGWLVDVYSF